MTSVSAQSVACVFPTEMLADVNRDFSKLGCDTPDGFIQNRSRQKRATPFTFTTSSQKGCERPALFGDGTYVADGGGETAFSLADELGDSLKVSAGGEGENGGGAWCLPGFS